MPLGLFLTSLSTMKIWLLMLSTVVQFLCWCFAFRNQKLTWRRFPPLPWVKFVNILLIWLKKLLTRELFHFWLLLSAIKTVIWRDKFAPVLHRLVSTPRNLLKRLSITIFSQESSLCSRTKTKLSVKMPLHASERLLSRVPTWLD